MWTASYPRALNKKMIFVGQFLWARHCADYFAYTNIFDPQSQSMREV
jgi:hypothetical protein